MATPVWYTVPEGAAVYSAWEYAQDVYYSSMPSYANQLDALSTRGL